MILRRRALIAASGLAATSFGLPRIALGQADRRPTITIAVQQIANSAALEPLREQSNVGQRVFSFMFERLIMPIFVGLQSVPKIAIAPLILVWVGAGIGSKILVVMSIAFFPIVINTMAGFKEVDQGLTDVFRSVAATERQMLVKLRLPYAVPYIFAGLRIATTLAVLGAIVAEWLAASNGLGYLVLSGSFNFNTARSFAAIIALAVIGTLFFNLMSWIETRVSWRSGLTDSTAQS